MSCVSTVIDYCAIPILITLYTLIIPTYTGTIEYESSSESWMEFYLRYCGGVCRNGSLENVSEIKFKRPYCFICDCEPTCSIYGTCCPTVDINNTSRNSLEDSSHAQIKNLFSSERFTCSSFPGDKRHFYMISDCRKDSMRLTQQHKSDKDSSNSNSVTGNHQSLDFIARCENSSMDTLDDVTPYLDLRYGITFKNKFCAICNGYNIESDKSEPFNEILVSGVNNLAGAWTINVSCSHYQRVYHMTSDMELFKAAFNGPYDECSIQYMQPKSLTGARLCDPMMQHNTETTCTSRDSKLRDYCLNLNHKYLLVEGGLNIFCYICSGVSPFYYHFYKQFEAGITRSRTIQLIPFSILLGATRLKPHVNLSDDIQCNKDQEWISDKGKCHQAECSAGKLMDSNGACRTALPDIRGLGYKLLMVLTPKDLDICVSRRSVQLLIDIIYANIYKVSGDVSLDINVTVLVKSRDTHKKEFVQKVSVLAHFISDLLRDRDSVETNIFDLVNGDWVVDLSGGSSITLIPTILGAEYSHLLDDSTDITVIKRIEINKKPNLKSTLPITPERTKTLNGSCTLFTDTPGANSISAVVKVYRSQRLRPNNYPFYVHKQWQLVDKFIDVTYSLTCPFVDVSYIDIKYNNNSFTFIFSFRDMNITVSSRSKVSLINGKLRICLDLYHNVTAISESTTEDVMAIVTLYLEYVCVALSIVCLLVTFVTYCLHAALRTLPGLNNMSLSMSLAIAQTLLLITAQFGVSGKLHSIHCLLHAIFLHYFWLASFMWMSACCVHMYRSFTNKGAKFINASSDNKRYLRYSLYAFGTPVVIVLLVIIVCLGLTKGSSIGYSNKFCFLDVELSLWIKLLSLIAPLSFTVLSNGVLFVLTVREIKYVSRLQKCKTEGHSVIIYTKLSTLTGIFYIVGAVALHLQSPVLYMLTSPIMCLQGLFIFVSFIFNKRVRKLYSHLLGCVGESSVTNRKEKGPVKVSRAISRGKVESITDSTSV